jgi:hypothetical protein
MNGTNCLKGLESDTLSLKKSNSSTIQMQSETLCAPKIKKIKKTNLQLANRKLLGSVELFEAGKLKKDFIKPVE